MSKSNRDKDAGSLEKTTFEQALAQIESIIERIETGQVGLEESLQHYERGVALVNHCRSKLDRAQQQVEDLTRRLERTDEQGPGRPAGDRRSVEDPDQRSDADAET